MGRQKKPHLHHIAAATLAFGIAQGMMTPAYAQDAAPTDTSETPITTTVTAPVIDGAETNTTIIPSEQGEAPLIISAQGEDVDTAAALSPVTSEVTTTYNIDPLMPIPLIAGFAALYAAFGVFPFRRRIKGAAMRAFAGATLTVLMVNPEIAQENRTVLPTEVLVIVDQSTSQRFGMRAEETAEAYEQIIQNLSGLENVNIRTIEIDGRNIDGALEDGTQLFSTMTQGLSDIPRGQLGAVIVITDGLIDDVPQQYEVAGEDVPIHIFVSGQEDEFDRRLEIVQSPQFGIQGGEQIAQIRIVDQGEITAEPANITVSANGVVIDEYTAMPGAVIDVTLPVSLTGANIYSFETGAIDGELTAVNNSISTQTEGVREDLNVLMLSGGAASSGRALRDVLRTDPGVNMVHFTTLRPPLKPQNQPLRELSLVPLPLNEVLYDRIDEFDMIILDRYALDGLLNNTHLRRMREYVEQGGSLLMIHGEEFVNPMTSLANSSIMRELLPVNPQGGGRSISEHYIPRVDEEGLRHPVTRDLPDGVEQGDENDPEWGGWLTRITDAQVVEDANVLLYGPNDDPLLVLNRVGEGRVASLMSDNFWLWARGYEGGGPHAELLQKVAHWLMAYPELEEENLRLSISEDGETLTVTRQSLAEDMDAPVVLTSPSGQEIEVPLTQGEGGLWQGSIAIDELGFYSATQQQTPDNDPNTIQIEGEINPLSMLQSFTSVGPQNPLEFQDTISTTERLEAFLEDRAGTIQRLANADAGQDAGNDNDGTSLPVITVPAFALQDAASPRETFTQISAPAIRQSDNFILEDITDRPLIPGWLGMMTALALLGGAWYREGGGQKLSFNRSPKAQAEPKPKAP